MRTWTRADGVVTAQPRERWTAFGCGAREYEMGPGYRRCRKRTPARLHAERCKDKLAAWFAAHADVPVVLTWPAGHAGRISRKPLAWWVSYRPL